eukprot:gene7075-17377_t
MTMKDLIHHNPKTNRMKSTVEAEEARKKKRRASNLASIASTTAANNAAADAAAATLAAVAAGTGGAAGSRAGAGAAGGGSRDPPPPASDPPPPPSAPPPGMTPSGDTPAALAAPRLMLDPETGEMVLDRSSLVVRSQRVSAEERSELIVQGTMKTTYASFTKRSKNTRWTAKETLDFFDGLKEFGTDFGMIQRKFLPERDHNQLKKKFQREDKKNAAKVTAALKRP